MEDTVVPKPPRAHRPRVLKRATIIISATNSEITCTVRNMHAEGAELKIDEYAALPGSFLLYVPTDGTAYSCELCWRQRQRVGVRFHGTLPKPKWHYG
ncbi:MAG: PilZ domain-containing protein [Allorhizobium sp.]